MCGATVQRSDSKARTRAAVRRAGAAKKTETFPVIHNPLRCMQTVNSLLEACLFYTYAYIHITLNITHHTLCGRVKKMELKQSFLACFLRALVQRSGPSVCAAILISKNYTPPSSLGSDIVIVLPPTMLVSLESSQGAYGPLLCNSKPIHRQAINLGNSSLYIWSAITNVLLGHIFTAQEERHDGCCQRASWGSLISLVLREASQDIWKEAFCSLWF